MYLFRTRLASNYTHKLVLILSSFDILCRLWCSSIYKTKFAVDHQTFAMKWAEVVVDICPHTDNNMWCPKRPGQKNTFGVPWLKWLCKLSPLRQSRWSKQKSFLRSNLFDDIFIRTAFQHPRFTITWTLPLPPESFVTKVARVCFGEAMSEILPVYRL